LLSWLSRLIAAVALLWVSCSAPAASPAFYDVTYRATFRPDVAQVEVEIELAGEKLPSRIRLRADPERYRNFHSSDPLQVSEQEVVWEPQGKQARLRYEFLLDHKRTGGYDSYHTRDWALFRGDNLVPSTAVTASKRLRSRATLELVLPPDWTAAMPYAADGKFSYHIVDPERRFDRPEGWMLVGKIGVRSERVEKVNVVIAAPEGENARRQDALAFINWNLPKLLEIFPQFPKRVLVVSAGDPMWRGGLSGPSSIFLHADRPLISENRTSPLLHELVHVAMGIHGDDESDWIVEGLAEFYSIQTLRDSGGIGQRRFDQAMGSMRRWAARSPSLFVKTSNGATTARAVLAFQAADAEIRKLTNNQASLDDVARKLAEERGEVTLTHLQEVAKRVAGRPLQSLQRDHLSQPIAESER
jgi:hypothetical protein